MSTEGMQKALLAVALVLATVFCTVRAEATRIRVSQESSPGSGYFDTHVLGFIESFNDSGITAAQSYAYNGAYGGTAISSDRYVPLILCEHQYRPGALHCPRQEWG